MKKTYSEMFPDDFDQQNEDKEIEIDYPSDIDFDVDSY